MATMTRREWRQTKGRTDHGTRGTKRFSFDLSAVLEGFAPKAPDPILDGWDDGELPEEGIVSWAINPLQAGVCGYSTRTRQYLRR